MVKVVDFLQAAAHMVAGCSAGSGIVVRSWEEGGIAVEGSLSHILAQHWGAVAETHSVELVCYGMQWGKRSHVLGLVVVADF
jgi:hypothetical protein